MLFTYIFKPEVNYFSKHLHIFLLDLLDSQWKESIDRKPCRGIYLLRNNPIKTRPVCGYQASFMHAISELSRTIKWRLPNGAWLVSTPLEMRFRKISASSVLFPVVNLWKQHQCWRCFVYFPRLNDLMPFTLHFDKTRDPSKVFNIDSSQKGYLMKCFTDIMPMS